MPENPSQHKVVIRGIVEAAKKRLHEALGFEDEDETVSVHKLEKKLKLPAVKELEKSLSLPTNTPEDVCKFFNSD